MKTQRHNISMYMKSVSYFRIVLLCLLPASLMAQPAQDGVFQRLVHEYTLQPDGSVDYHHFRQLRIDSYYGFHRKFGETFIVYNPEFEKLSIREAFTVMADGSRIPLPENALNEVLPRHAEGAAPYHKLREMVVTHTGLETGATIYLDYTLKRFPGKLPILSGAKILAEDVAVDQLTFILRAPDGIPIHHRIFNLDMNPEVTHKNGMTEYRWELRDIPALVTPPLGVSPFYHVPSAIFSTGRDMETVWSAFLDQEAFLFSANADITVLADSLKRISTSDLELALRFQEIVEVSIRTWPINLHEIGYNVRKAGETWDAAGGTPLDKAVLLTALCRAANLKAYPVACTEKILFDKGIGLPQAFTDPLVRISLKDRTIYLNPNQKNKYSEDLSKTNKYFIPLDPRERLIEQPAPDKPASISIKSSLEYTAKSGVKGTVSVKTNHAACPEFQLLKGDDPWKLLGKMKGYQLENKPTPGKNAGICEHVFQIKNDEPLPVYGKHTFINWPHPPDVLKDISSHALTSSEIIPTVLPYGLEISYQYELSLPSGFRLAGSALQNEIRSDAGYFSASLLQQKNKVIFNMTLSINAIIPKERDGFIELINQYLSPSWQGVYIVEDKK